MKYPRLHSKKWQSTLLATAALVGGSLFTPELSAQTFQRYYGLDYDDLCHEVQVTQDSGYVMVGQTNVPGSDEEIMVLKTDSNGTPQWDLHIGGAGDQVGRSIKQTTAGEYIVFGETDFNTAGGTDWLLTKVDQSGNVLWSHTYGGSYDEVAKRVYHTNDNGYLLVGGTESYTTSTPNGTIMSVYVIKTDAFGNLQWARWIGGDSSNGLGIDCGLAGMEAANNDFYITGRMSSYGNPAPNSDDIFLARISTAGGVVILQTYGHSALDHDEGVDLMENQFGDIFIGATIRTTPGTNGNPAIVRTDPNCNLQSADVFFGSGNETGQTKSIQFANGSADVQLGGWTEDFTGTQDFFLVEADASMSTVQVSKTYGGSDLDEFSHMEITPKGQIIHAGHSLSFPAPRADWEVYLVKTEIDGTIDNDCPSDVAFSTIANISLDTAIVLQPGNDDDDDNIADNYDGVDLQLLYDTICGLQDYGTPVDTGMGNQMAYKANNLTFYPEDICNSIDGGYAITGYITYSGINKEVFIQRAETDGTLRWNRSYGKSHTGGYAASNDHGKSILATHDDGYVVFGETQLSSSSTNLDWFLMKTDMYGTPQWTQRYSGSGDELAKKVVESSRGHLLVGSTKSYGSGQRIYLMEVNTSGIANWSTVITGGGSFNADVANDAIQDVNGDYFVTGRTNSYGAGKEDIFIAKVEGISGNLLWFKTYGYSKADAGLSIQIVNGELVVGATARTIGTDRDPTIVITDLNGVLQHNKSMLGAPSDLADRGVSIEAVDGGTNLVFAGWTSSFGGTDKDAFLVKTDINLNSLVWQYVFNRTHEDLVKAMVVSPATQEHRILCASKSPSSNATYDVLVHNTDHNGVLEGACETSLNIGFYSWALTLGQPFPGIGQGGMAVRDSLTPDTLVLNTDTLCGHGTSNRLATAGDAANGVAETAFAEVSAFPNPFSGELSFTWSQASAGPVQIVLVNAQGQVVWNHLEDYGKGDNKAELPELNLPQGMYLYAVTMGEETKRGKVVKTQ